MPDFRYFTDTPLNVWASDRLDKQERGGAHKTSSNKQPQSAEVKKAKEQGLVLAKLSADYLPHPQLFAVVAEALGATVVEVCAAKYTDVPMACIIGFTDKDKAIALQQEPIQVDDTGAWYVQVFQKFV
jgi:hypothetical protein